MRYVHAFQRAVLAKAIKPSYIRQCFPSKLTRYMCVCENCEQNGLYIYSCQIKFCLCLCVDCRNVVGYGWMDGGSMYERRKSRERPYITLVQVYVHIYLLWLNVLE